ncbi:MAG: hypothetical protein LUH48_01010 [Clostridiales bacterium]|nr:hypothetical protein [Clostridiales bacterium]
MAEITLTVARVIGGLLIILLSIFLMSVGLGPVLAIPTLAITVICVSDLTIFAGIDEEVVAATLQCGVDQVGWMMGGIPAGAVIISFMGAGTVGNVMCGLDGIAIGILTMGVFGTDVAEAVADLACIPLVGFAVVFFLVCMVLGGF